ncbi:MAG: NADH-quinone oxidoreductase subunit I [Chloroflexi bacterium]|nr:NADH-quinone oxidoreductase subunit I [Chloroflexota bacterium]
MSLKASGAGEGAIEAPGVGKAKEEAKGKAKARAEAKAQSGLAIPGIGLMKGLGVVLKNSTRKRITEQYPEERLTVSRRTRAQELVWDPGPCTGCATCVKACPQGNIKIVTSVNAENNKYIVEKFENDEGRCIFCGLCVEACPYEALFFGRSYERARYRRNDLIADMDEMSSDKKERSAYARPELHEQLPEQTLLIYRKHKRIL